MNRNQNLQRHAGLLESGELPPVNHEELHRSILVKLSSQGYSVSSEGEDKGALELASDLFKRYAEQGRLLAEHLCPPDARIQEFLDHVFDETGDPRVKLPTRTLVLDRYGLARQLSIPEKGNEYHNSQISSYRLDNGVLHNPLNDRRTTKGVFHVADVGLPVPADKVPVPLLTYQRLLAAAFRAPKELLRLPYTADSDASVEGLVSLLLRPLVAPAVPGVRPEQRMEVRFFAPAGLVANLDFVESIFGNGGDPHLQENNAALQTDTWTGHSGCVVVAPHLVTSRKVDLGLPNVADATEEQKAQGMCWQEEGELYNEGRPFKITLRDESGTMVTILADSYFGYCKKEVKTQIGLSANLSGLAEEEHAGGALAFASYNLGSRFLPHPRMVGTQHAMSDALRVLGDTVDLHESGYATDRRYPTIHVLPEDMEIDLEAQVARWSKDGKPQSVRVLPGHTYVHPSGYKVRLNKHEKAPTWRLIGTVPEGTFVHKPCTVSGGGKSEISKSLDDAVIYGPIYTSDFEQDMDRCESILERDYSAALRNERRGEAGSDPGRPLLSEERSLGSVIKLLTPNPYLYTDEHNDYIRAIPNNVRAMVFAIKRFQRPAWGDQWRRHFSVDIVNGAPGHELKLDGRTLVGSYLRVGRHKSGEFRNYKLRHDFISADKVQMEDDITASTVVPAEQLKGLPREYAGHRSLKIAQNCEFRLFQRPDDAIIPGFDKQAESDLAAPGLFASNFEPLSAEQITDLVERVDQFEPFTKEMKAHLRGAANSSGKNVCSARPRLVNGKPTKNPRYLQVRPDLVRAEEKYLAELGARLYRQVPAGEEVLFPVLSVLSGRRNNPPDEINGVKIRPLCVFNPIHYQELPELFMDYVCSVTGKSPSTTGAGSEGALTKGPFNAIFATADLNNALVSMLLTQYGGFSTAAGWIGPGYRVDHDISVLIPEIWCRLLPEERDPVRMIERGHLEKIDDFEYQGERVPASRLGYRITKRFVHNYFGRVFDNPTAVFTEELLQPEKQDLAVFADGVSNLVEAQRKSALRYFEDGSVECACPPLRAVLHVMAYGHYHGKGIEAPEVRKLFTREALLESDWYRARLEKKQERDVALWSRHVQELRTFMERPGYESEVERLGVKDQLDDAQAMLERVSARGYPDSLIGTIGADLIVEVRARATDQQGREAKPAGRRDSVAPPH